MATEIGPLEAMATISASSFPFITLHQGYTLNTKGSRTKTYFLSRHVRLGMNKNVSCFSKCIQILFFSPLNRYFPPPLKFTISLAGFAPHPPLFTDMSAKNESLFD